MKGSRLSAPANAGAYDREVFLVLKEFEPSLSRGGDMDMKFLAGEPSKTLKQIGKEADERNKQHKEKGYEVNYKLFSINGKMLGAGDPIRVKVGERVLFHVLNASAGETRSLALPGHAFRVVALDGNPVPAPAEVPVLWLGTAESFFILLIALSAVPGPLFTFAAYLGAVVEPSPPLIVVILGAIGGIALSIAT